MNNKFKRYFTYFFLILWASVSILACAGMYRLWWGRERVLYFAKPVTQQRLYIFKNAGLPPKLLNVHEKIIESWPREVSYKTLGDFNQLSYIKYLLIPKIPKGSEKYSVSADGSFSPDDTVSPKIVKEKKSGTIVSLIGSLFLLSGISLILKRYRVFSFVSFPELFGVSLFLCMVCTVFSRILFATCVPGFFFFTLMALLCWCLLTGQNIFQGNILLQRFLSGKWRRGLFDCRDLGRFTSYFCILLILLSVLWAFLMAVVVVPDDWDAWATWGAKAKVLALGHGPLSDVSYFGHASYPLLWPSIWAYSGWLSGGWEEMWVRGWGSVFLFLCIWEVVVIVERITGRREMGLLCGALFASVPMVPLIASWSYADIPLCYFFLITYGCLISLKNARTHYPIVMTAVLAAAAAYTKNEGVMFSVLILCFIPFVVRRNTIFYMVSFIIIFSLLYAPWIVWKDMIHHFQSSATAGLHFDLANLRRIWLRIPSAFDVIIRMWSDIRQWNVVLWFSLIWLCIGLFQKESRKWQCMPLALLAGYFLFIISNAYEIYWQVGTSWNRLTVHALSFLSMGMVIQFSNLFPSRKKIRS